jgi:hypothetical protein
VEQLDQVITKKTIAIIGAEGNISSVIARRLARAASRLLLFGNDSDNVIRLINEIRIENPAADAEEIICPIDASWEADLILFALPYNKLKELAYKIREVATGKIVIIMADSLQSNDSLVTPAQTTIAEELQVILPYSKLVAIVDNSIAGDVYHSSTDDKSIELYIESKDDEAIASVSDLLKELGFNPVTDMKFS